MADFPYADAAKRLESFFSKIQESGVPDTVDNKWLDSIGFKGRSGQIKRILKYVHFVTDEDRPTKRWQDYRDTGQSKKVMTEGVKQGYSALFEQYSDAHQRGDGDLRNFFKANSKVGSTTVAKMIATFRILCSLADFGQEEDGTQEGQEAIDPVESSTPATEPDSNDDQSKSPQADQPFSPELNINIQVHISSDATAEQIDKIFESMAKHLFNQDID